MSKANFFWTKKEINSDKCGDKLLLLTSGSTVISGASSLPAFRYPRPFHASIASLDIIITTTLTHLNRFG
jgi:hypothetical protein